MCANVSFFKFVRVRFKKNNALRYEKSDKKTNVLNLERGKKWTFQFFKKCLLAPQEVNFYLCTTKRCPKETSLG